MKDRQIGNRGIGVVGVTILIGVLVLVIGGGLAAYGYLSGLRSTGTNYETTANAQYLDNQNYLANYTSGFYEQVGVANLKSEKMDKILLDAVKGRYEGSGGFSANGAFFAAIVEAYPDLAGLNVYDKIVDYVAAGREGYRAQQSKLLDVLRSYDNWRGDGLVQPWIIEHVLEIPSNRLEARIGTTVVRGQAARDQMFLIVTTEETQEAYKKGTMKPLTAPKQ